MINMTLYSNTFTASGTGPDIHYHPDETYKGYVIDFDVKWILRQKGEATYAASIYNHAGEECVLPLWVMHS